MYVLLMYHYQTLRTDKEKESARHDEEVQELVDKHGTEQMEIGKQLYTHLTSGKKY